MQGFSALSFEAVCLDQSVPSNRDTAAPTAKLEGLSAAFFCGCADDGAITRGDELNKQGDRPRTRL